MSDNLEHYSEVGKLLSDAIMIDAISLVASHGATDKIVFSPKIELSENEIAGCVTVTYTRQDGTTLTYHRPT